MLRYVKYGMYMILVIFKGFKYNWINFKVGKEKAALYASTAAKKWANFTIKTIGIELEVKGLENIPSESCVFIGNHSSILDIPILLTLINGKTAFIAKKEALDMPILGAWLKRTGSIPLDRSNPRSAVATINEGVERIKSGYNMVIFPEGTRKREHKKEDFKKGSFKLATKSKAPIVPVTIDGAYKCYEDKKKFIGKKIKVSFGKPVYTKDLLRSDEVNMINEVVDSIFVELKQN